MSVELLYITSDSTKDITAFTGGYRRSDNKDSLGMEFEFTITKNPYDKYTRTNNIALGNKVIFIHNDQKVFSGIIAKVSRNSLSQMTYTCYDYGFYLNKSEAIIQYNNITTTEALKRLCSENGISVGVICDIPTKVKKIYNGEKISDVIKDLLKMATDDTGEKYRLEIRGDRLFIEKYQDLVILATYQSARNVGEFDVTQMVGSFSSEQSIENMATRVIVVSSSEKNQQVYANVASSDEKQFGMLTKVEKVEDKNKAQALSIAEKKLKELDKIKRSFSVTLFGDDNVRSGRMLVFNRNEIDLVGAVLVKNCIHTYNGKTHLMQLDLEV